MGYDSSENMMALDVERNDEISVPAWTVTQVSPPP